jgi:hypothetical protein
MFSRHSVASDYRDGDPPVVASLRWATEPHPRSLGGFLASGAFYAVVLVSLTVVIPFGKDPKEKRVVRKTANLYIPPVRRPSEIRKRPPIKVISPSAPKIPLEDPIAAPPPKRLDMNSIEISIAEDVGNQLPEVVRQQGGMLAFIDRKDQSIARYIFEPPDWTMRESILDISDKIRFSMIPASKWLLLSRLAQSHGIDLERFEAGALFESDYRGCLEQEIRSYVASGRNSGRVQSALLAFNSKGGCGIDVISVQFVPSR